MYLMNVRQSSIHRWKTALFLCATVRLCHYYTSNHCFPLFSSISRICRFMSSPIRLSLRLSVVRVYVKPKEWEIRWKGRDVTMFCWRAEARCCAPSSSIWFQSRFSVMSVYVKQKEWEMGWKGRDVTLFCWRAVARCCAPSSSIWL
jgi:hypothetical protein